MNYTKGPWTASKGHIGGKIADFVRTGIHDGLHITIGEKTFNESSLESEANALLIAAAPEMLNLLIWLVNNDFNTEYTHSDAIHIIEKATGKKWEEIEGSK